MLAQQNFIHSRLKGYTKQTKNEVKMNESEIAHHVMKQHWYELHISKSKLVIAELLSLVKKFPK